MEFAPEVAVEPEPIPAPVQPSPVAVERPPAVDVSAALAAAGIVLHDDAGYDDSACPTPRDGLNFLRNDGGHGRLITGDDLAHLDEDSHGYDFSGPCAGEPPLTWTDHVTGRPNGRDERPSWLVRHLPYQIPWWPQAWADRAVTFAPTPATFQPFAIWAPGLGAQPAHVHTLRQVVEVQEFAKLRVAWCAVREEVEDAGTDIESEWLWQTHDEAEYKRAVALLGPNPEPWDADCERPVLSPRDRAYALAVEAHRERATVEARRVRDAQDAARGRTRPGA